MAARHQRICILRCQCNRLAIRLNRLIKQAKLLQGITQVIRHLRLTRVLRQRLLQQLGAGLKLPLLQQLQGLGVQLVGGRWSLRQPIKSGFLLGHATLQTLDAHALMNLVVLGVPQFGHLRIRIILETRGTQRVMQQLRIVVIRVLGSEPVPFFRDFADQGII